MSKKNFYIFPRLYNYGGIMNTLLKALPIANVLNLNVKIIHLPINIKSNGKLFVRDMKNLQTYKFLSYNKIVNSYIGIDILILKIDLFIKTLIKRNKFFSIFIKCLFVLKNLNITKAKIKFSNYLNSQNFFSGEFDKKNLDYLKRFQININQENFQKIYLNRKPFDLINYDEILSQFNNLDLPPINEKFICFHLREKQYNLSKVHLKKDNNVIFYSKNDFQKSLKFLIKSNINIFDLSNFYEKIELDPKLYIDLLHRKINDEKIKYLLSKNCEFFISTGGGISELPRLFKKPILRIDHEYNVFNNFSFSTLKDNIIFCNIYDKEKKIFLSIESQFKNLKNIFPKLNHFNHERFTMVKNNFTEINDLIINRNFDDKYLETYREEQKEIFNIKNYYFKKEFPDYYALVNEFNPINPYINNNFFKKNIKYSDYLEKKTIEYNRLLLRNNEI